MIKLNCKCGTIMFLQSTKDKELNLKCTKCLQKELNEKINYYNMRRKKNNDN
jgi:DNA-directed RNA polymerase subunit M/transcription elongation factor TFIIS